MTALSMSGIENTRRAKRTAVPSIKCASNNFSVIDRQTNRSKKIAGLLGQVTSSVPNARGRSLIG